MKVEIYTKADCSLCEEAKRIIQRVRKRVPFELVEVDIMADASLFDRYRYDIPVVRIDGRFAFRHRLDDTSFEARLRQTNVD